MLTQLIFINTYYANAVGNIFFNFVICYVYSNNRFPYNYLVSTSLKLLYRPLSLQFIRTYKVEPFPPEKEYKQIYKYKFIYKNKLTR